MGSTRRIERVVIVGAGIAGLTAARILRTSGRSVVVLEKALAPGGRLATRRIGDAVCDHGAQYFTARDPRFLRMLERWMGAGVAAEWGGWPQAGEPRYIGREGMVSISRHLARDLDIRFGTGVRLLEPSNGGWRLGTEGDGALVCDAAILTPPVPQALELLDAGGVPLAAENRRALDGIRYEPCLAAMAVLDGPSAVPGPGGIEPSEGPLVFVAENRKKGISPRQHALTVQAAPDYSREHADQEPAEAARELLGLADPWIGRAKVIDSGFTRWHYSRPVEPGPSPCLVVEEPAPLLFAGDAFGGPRVEGASLSGLAAAWWILFRDR